MANFVAVSIIKNPRRIRYCADCHLPLRFAHLRLYGGYEQKPYEVRQCFECGKQYEKSRLAIEAFEKQQDINQTERLNKGEK